MSSSLAIEAGDASGRWYLSPGASNAYDLKLANTSDHSVLCKLNLDEPADAGSLSPASLTLNAGESRLVSLSFKPDWLTLRDRKVVVSARNAAGTVLATFVHDLVAATSTDCSVALAWKDEIVADGALRGFTLLCTVRSISSTPGVFEPEFVAHPSLRFPEKQRIALGPGESSAFEVPVVWNRSTRDVDGWNHPRTIEVGIAVTHGRRSASAPWDLVQQHIEPFITDNDRAPVIARRPPPPQFTAPGGIAPVPAVAPVPPPPLHAEPLAAPVVTESHSERIARNELEAGVTAAAPISPLRLPQTVPPPAPAVDSKRQVIAVSPSTLAMIAVAFGAIVIAMFWELRPNANAPTVSTAPVPVVTAPATFVPKPIQHHAKAPHGKAKRGAAKPLASAAPVVTTAAAVPTAAPAATVASGASTGARSASTPAPARALARTAAAPARFSAADRSALVQLGDVSAQYASARRVVVSWDSYAQAGADIQLLNSQSAILAETRVGRRESASLLLPRGYRGTVYVQVTAIGYHGERVVSSTSL